MGPFLFPDIAFGKYCKWAVNAMQNLLETAFNDLVQRAIAAFPDTARRQHIVDTVSVSNIELLPAENALIAKAKVRGTNGKTYQCVIQFSDVEYNPEEGSDVASFTSGGKEYKITPIQQNDANVHVGCNCLDFRWRFAYYNKGVDALYGPVPPWYAKVPGSNRPDANPTKSPGVCKHLMDFADELANSGLTQ